jgi:D-glycero-D-manno-heptose 1,7-bisphosphate phosphatase
MEANVQEVVMVLGPPASGKSELSNVFIKQGYVHLNRDKAGGRVIDLLPEFKKALAAGKNVVLDNLFAKKEDRAPFIAAAQAAKVPVNAHVMQTSIEDCTINALHRMWDRYGMLFMTANDIKEHSPASKDPNIFPIVVLFAYKKNAEKPTMAEGFASITVTKFVRRPLPPEYKNKAVIFDFDDTLREVVGGEYQFPTRIEEVSILPGRVEKLKELRRQGYIILGASNQSGIARKQVTLGHACQCFEHTGDLLGGIVDYHFCPHNVPPSCYCRKPQSGMAISLIHRHKLNPAECIYVGDQTTDKTFAQRVGFKYFDAKDFFK